MTEFVVFTLAAPMGSFGGLAGHEYRSSNLWPNRSALLGLLGAALGIRREDTARQGELKTWQTAVSVLSESIPLRDFHTVQTVPSARIKNPQTRRDAIDTVGKNNTIITRRDYRCDCVFGAAVWGCDNLDKITSALKNPTFTTYLGRKSCPLSSPMSPRKVKAQSVEDALKEIVLPPYITDTCPKLIISDEKLPNGWEEIHWVEPVDRDLWHFGQHKVHISKPGLI